MPIKAWALKHKSFIQRLKFFIKIVSLNNPLTVTKTVFKTLIKPNLLTNQPESRFACTGLCRQANQNDKLGDKNISNIIHILPKLNKVLIS
ncbi:hypothetical protein A2531_02120 [Candidatus Falkowbacteria bacterium RIFOXYD2_FULL_34_120]|uniref:Uncharacterized protein n=1 Tax=Candidatus Falkowbacteria bacterium RIFOXYD2_FULL_34_120 TaxID=1798007 RepID=A0A1F5TR98_9BACT|nr:MAG: hypothetical protein A2500_04115 [Candidatus Falkowbacteria bacterium RIFOXYC12_FULL_34_55]OGF37127.1 MAG: hypothetical protein A2466_02405 [Candidatus Falkowbacteria bacterium RIFOXYC2_FULL_34_220]OGF39552.1 MAG: hypothetical protein A2515_04480 [Candidatus Falkowbacteria bacterium RIFOXYD12_FULL_34_57]OGF41465.1 MAG: hypothetical protein A2531_02120 [Candidatus Falkowbacteria bacterium RIFOXYD2_FULL_34_120]